MSQTYAKGLQGSKDYSLTQLTGAGLRAALLRPISDSSCRNVCADFMYLWLCAPSSVRVTTLLAETLKQISGALFLCCDANSVTLA